MGTVAGIEIGLPSDIDGVTAEWLTAALRTSGAIGTDTSVASRSARRFAEGLGLLSELHRVDLTYDGPADGAPDRVIVKFAIDDPAQRGVAEVLGFYAKELEFYRTLGPTMPFRVARAYAAARDDVSGDFILVMEDLSDLRRAEQIIGVSWPDALRSARTMAKLHAAFHEHEALPEMAATYVPLENPIYLAALPGVFAAGWEGAQTHAADLLTPEIKAFGDRYGDCVPFFLSSLMQPATLLHGDWRADNLFYGSASPDDDDDRMAVVDFQIMGQGSGAYDLAYFASQSIDSSVRSGRDGELIAAYLAALAEAGVERDAEEFTRHYRIALAHCLIYGVTSFQSYEALPENSRQMMRTMLDRSVRSIVDMESLALLP